MSRHGSLRRFREVPLIAVVSRPALDGGFMATQCERIGFIGLGSMGRPMATSLVRKGFALSAYDTAAAHTAVLVERGATRAGDLAALVFAADVVITMLPNTPDVAGVVS